MEALNWKQLLAIPALILGPPLMAGSLLAWGEGWPCPTCQTAHSAVPPAHVHPSGAVRRTVARHQRGQPKRSGWCRSF